MTTTKFKRRSISLDDTSHDRCKILADDMATSVSGLLRLIIEDAFDEYQRIAGKQIRNRPPLL